MTEEQKKLVEENQGLIYKFLSNYQIYDEDMFQELVVHICSVIDNYDPNKSAFSTWVFTVCKNKICRENRDKHLQRVVPKEIISSLDAPYKKYHDGDVIELGDVIEDRKGFNEILAIEYRLDWEIAENLYKERYPKTYQKDLYIYKSIVLEQHNCVELASQYNVTRQAINLTYQKTKKNLKKLLDYHALVCDTKYQRSKELQRDKIYITYN